MKSFHCKQILYEQVDLLREKLEITANSYPLDTISLCEAMTNIALRLLPFKTKALRGMAIVGKQNQSDIVLLSSELSMCEQNFYCAHELIHLNLHRNAKRKTFECMDLLMPTNDNFLEWQANEGAAELLMPYREVLPMVYAKKDALVTRNQIIALRLDISQHFNVTEFMAKYRLESLKYEIEQYLNGTAINMIEILSVSEQIKRGIFITSYSAQEDKLLQDGLAKIKRLRNVDIYRD